MPKRTSLKDELKKKFGSPRACILALGLDESLISVPRLAFDGANQMKPNRLQALLVTSAARIFNPQLAMDAKGVNYAKLFEGATTANLKARKPTIVSDAKKMLAGKTLAKDASVEGLAHLLDQFERVKEPKSLDESVSEPQHKAMEAAANGHSTLGIPKDVGEEFARADKGKGFDAIRDWATGKGMSEDDIEELRKLHGEDEDPVEALDENETEEEKAAREKKEAADKAAKDKAAKDEAAEEEERKKREAADKAAKDKGMTGDEVSKVVQAAVASERKRNRATAEAREFVRPYVGELPMALDSCEDVHRAAARALDIEDADTVHPSALPALIKALGRKAGAQALNEHTTLAADSASIVDAFEFFPEARRIG